MRPLAGIRIVDLSMGWAGPLACRHLADLGADVIKVESCERFDWWRSWEATEEWIADNGAEKSVAFNMVNRNKRAITLDLEHPEGRDLFLQLVKTANAVVENYSGNVMPKLGLNYEVLKAAKSDIILLSMPAFGSTGPWAKFRAYGSTVEQSSGLPHLQGFVEDQPTMLHVALGDAVGGITGASALLTALRHQARTGAGQFVDQIEQQQEHGHALAADRECLPQRHRFVPDAGQQIVGQHHAGAARRLLGLTSGLLVEDRSGENEGREVAQAEGPQRSPAANDREQESRPPGKSGRQPPKLRGVLDIMRESLRAGEIKEFTEKDVTDWKVGPTEEIDGETFQTGEVIYEAQTIFGKKKVRVQAMIRGGKVEMWRYAKTKVQVE